MQTLELRALESTQVPVSERTSSFFYWILPSGCRHSLTTRRRKTCCPLQGVPPSCLAVRCSRLATLAGLRDIMGLY